MIYAIVLAAGRSERMGTQKLLLPWGESSIVGHIVEQLLQSTVDGTVVVTGQSDALVSRELKGRPVTLVFNPDWSDGMLSSVRCGIGALPPDCSAALVALGDQPTITSQLINQLIGTFDGADSRILVPVWNGRRGHPLLFSRFYFSEILTRFDDIGLRGLLRAHESEIQEVKVSTPSVLDDIDRPEDYLRARRVLNGGTQRVGQSGSVSGT